MAPLLRLRQFTPFFPTTLASPSPTATTLPELVPSEPSIELPPTTPATETVAEATDQDVGENFGPLLNYTIWMMTGVSFIVIMLRFYCKLSRDRRLWWDDWVLQLAWVGSSLSFRPFLLVCKAAIGADKGRYRSSSRRL